MSNEFIGRRRAIGIGKETVAGTGVTPTFWLPFAEASMKPVIEKARDTGAYNVIDEVRDSETVKKMTETSISAILRDDWFGLILLGALGSVSSAVVSGSVKDHTFTVDQTNNHKSFSLVGYDPVDEFRSTYNLLDSLEIEAVTGDFVKMTAVFKGKSIAATSGSSVTYTDSNEFLAKHCTVRIAPDSTGVDAAATVAVTRFRLTIQKNVVDYLAFGDDDVASLHNQQLTVTGEFEMLYNSIYYRDAVQATGDDAKKAIKLTMTNSDVTIGGSYYPTLTVLLYKAALETWSQSEEINGLVRQTVGFVGEYDVDNSKTMQMILRNTTASY